MRALKLYSIYLQVGTLKLLKSIKVAFPQNINEIKFFLKRVQQN